MPKTTPPLVPPVAAEASPEPIAILARRVKYLQAAIVVLALINLIGLIWLVVLTINLPNAQPSMRHNNCINAYCPLQGPDNNYR